MNICDVFNKYLRASAASAIHASHCPTEGDDIEKLLAELSVFGDPKLIKMDTGWWCFIDAVGATRGTRLTVSSANHHNRPAHAISECLDRVKASGLPFRTDNMETPSQCGI